MNMPQFTADASLYRLGIHHVQQDIAHSTNGISSDPGVIHPASYPNHCDWWEWLLEPIGCAIGYDIHNTVVGADGVDCDWEGGICFPRGTGRTAQPLTTGGVTVGPPPSLGQRNSDADNLQRQLNRIERCACGYKGVVPAPPSWYGQY
jgi:hypothetical protein